VYWSGFPESFKPFCAPRPFPSSAPLPAGEYRVCARWSSGANRATAAAYQVASDGAVVADAIAWVGLLTSDAAADLTDVASAQPIQAAVDTGDQPWRLGFG